MPHPMYVAPVRTNKRCATANLASPPPVGSDASESEPTELNETSYSSRTDEADKMLTNDERDCAQMEDMHE